MECWDATLCYMSWAMIAAGVAHLWLQNHIQKKYGRYIQAGFRCCPAKMGWSIQELPSFLVPMLLLLLTEDPDAGSGSSGLRRGRTLLLCTFTLHYFHRSFIYGTLTRGRPVPLSIVLSATIFCSLNGFMQGHHLLHCGRFEDSWLVDARLATGFLLFVCGMGINIHSDQILRNLRKPGEIVYRIPHGGMFEFVSGANFFGEIVEWCGYAIAAWSLPSFAFAFHTICFIGPRACHHHRNYQEKFEDYPPSRKALIPFLF
uniref:3-oxo-5alpha-steroid 4-dehydrogenase (NADP(+)) n=1 Tax=Monopterus albus TaxID=43700 RepID=A0A3Q3IVY2_MONAL|nr:3-oxo-5-alpha-steroid 4-dehydrogenase 2 [Monopterus albus]